MSPDARKLSTLDIFPSVEENDRVLVLRPDAPDPKDRVGTAKFPVTGTPLPIAYTLAQAQQDLADSVDLTVGARYDITGNWNAAGAPATVFVPALRADAFSPSGILFTGGAYAVVRVNVAAGTTSPVASAEVQAQHTQLLTDLTALVPAKATPTNQFATLADIGQITFVDVPLALINGSYAIPKDCAGKRFIISDGTADTFISLRALNNDSVGKVFALTIDNGVRQRLVAYAFGSATGGGAYVELAETALLLAGKSYAGPAGSFYYNAFKIGAPPTVKSVNGILPDAAGNVTIATGGGGTSDAYTKAETDQKDAALQRQLDDINNNGGPVLQRFVFEPGYADSYTFTAGPDVAGVYGTEGLSNVSSSTYYIGLAVTALPLTIKAGDKIRVDISRQSSTQVASVTLSK